jgi:hypothetical protein
MAALRGSDPILFPRQDPSPIPHLVGPLGCSSPQGRTSLGGVSALRDLTPEGPTWSTPSPRKSRKRKTASMTMAGKMEDGRLLLTKHQATDLGELIANDVKLLHGLGWQKFVSLKRGRADLHPDVGQLPHPASQYLDNLRR